jgi:hypothetical protein
LQFSPFARLLDILRQAFNDLFSFAYIKCVTRGGHHYSFPGSGEARVGALLPTLSLVLG